MATRPNDSPTGPGPQHFQLPNARELRAQAVHRLQIGIFGLAAMLLLVGLANIIMDRARQAESGVSGTSQVQEAPKANTDPLADIGAVPSPETTQSTAKAAPAPN
ncbi:hypothetical protein [Novosphingobium sp.]|uniref:hypothetical protein n=1 Tax=Novosphingobium sp. TaxID=1874826 RepID=UPI00286E99E2|nr:hypothetical protein [Novosphingobium sp.]